MIYLPLYEFVESKPNSNSFDSDKHNKRNSEISSDVFRSGHNRDPNKPRISMRRQISETKAKLIHDELQDSLYEQLSQKFGKENVGTENNSASKGKIDAVSRKNGERIIYEIKVDTDPRFVIRDAIGQLLEYAFWPGATKPTELVIVGIADENDESCEYLKKLNDIFSSVVKLSYYKLNKPEEA